MKCPACGFDNTEDAKRCSSCAERFPRRARRQESLDQSDSPFGKTGDSRNATALRAYKYSVLALIPLAGLVFGPLALGYAGRAWWEGRRDPRVRRLGHIYAAALLGFLTLLAHGTGVYLVVQGLTGP